MIFRKTLKQDLTHQISNQTDHWLNEQKAFGLTKDELGAEIIKELVELKEKAYSYLKDNSNEDKNAKGIKKCVIKRKLKFQNHKNGLEAYQIENKINHLEKYRIDLDSLKEYQKQLKTLKTQQRFRSRKHNVFTEEINKIALSSNYDKRMQ